MNPFYKQKIFCKSCTVIQVPKIKIKYSINNVKNCHQSFAHGNYHQSNTKLVICMNAILSNDYGYHIQASSAYLFLSFIQ